MKSGWTSADRRRPGRLIPPVVWGITMLSLAGLVVLALAGISHTTAEALAVVILTVGTIGVTWLTGWMTGLAFLVVAATVGTIAADSVLPLILASVNTLVVAGVAYARSQVDRLASNRTRLGRQQADLSSALDIAYRQVRYEAALSAFAKSFISGTDDTERQLAMEELLAAIDCDALVIGLNVLSERGNRFEPRYSSVADGGSIDLEGFRFHWADVPSLAATLASGTDARFSDSTKVDATDHAQLDLIDARFEAMLAVPLTSEGDWSGAMLIGQRLPGRDWLSREVSLVWSIADMIAAAFRREDTLGNLKLAVDARDIALQAQSALTESSRILLEGLEDNAFDRALSVMLRASSVSAAFIQEVDGDKPRLIKTIHLVTRNGGAGIEFPETSILPDDVATTLKSRQPWMVEDKAALSASDKTFMDEHFPGVRAELRFPIVLDGKTVGTVGLANHEAHRFNGTEVQLVGSIASMLAAYMRRERAKHDLEGLITAKDRFIATVGHELRTPMSVILGLSSELSTRREDFTDEEAAEFTDLISRQSREVSNIIEDLLVSARATETGLTVQPSPMDLGEVTRSVLDSLPAEHTWRIVQVTTDPTPVIADELRVRQIVRNLIVNSHRYGGEEVFVRVTNVDDMAVVAVTDTGQKIPDEHRANMFEAYATSEHFQGRPSAIGLGLTVSRQLARLMSGDVTYTYTGLSEFKLSLPFSGFNLIALTPESTAVTHIIS